MNLSYLFRFCVITIVVLACAFLTAHLSSAADSNPDAWEFHLAPYAWLAGQSGSVATLPGLPAADIDVDFYDDILGNINGAFMLVGEARKGSFGITSDIVYTDIESDLATPGQVFTTLSSQTTSWIVSAAGFYRFFENGKTYMDGLAGARYWSVDSELSLRGGPGGYYTIDNSENWFDPTVGVRGFTMLGNTNFFMSGFLLFGGFNVGSDFMWDANVNLGYQWTPSISTTIGYRYLDVDYEDDDFLYDVSQDGIVLGLSFRF